MGAPEWIARIQGLLASGVRVQHSLLHAAHRLPGFQFDETMTGKVSFVGVGAGHEFPPGDRGILLRLHAQAERLGDYLRDGCVTLTGTASIEGLVESAPLRGSLWIWPHRRIVRYELYFLVGEKSLRLSGQKDVRLLDFRRTMSTLPAKLYDEHGAEVGHATVVFDWADLPVFVRGFALVQKNPGASPDAASAASGSPASRPSPERPA